MMIKNTKVIFLVAILFQNLFFGQSIVKYKGIVELDSLKIIRGDYKLTYENNSHSILSFCINKNAENIFIKYEGKQIPFKAEPFDGLPDLQKIIIDNNFRQKFDLEVSYQYSLAKILNPTFTYNPHWIELSLYTGWIPINFDDKNYSFNIRFILLKPYEVISSGNRIGNRFVNKNNYKDIPAVISDKFQKFDSKNGIIQFRSIDLDENLRASIGDLSQKIFNFYQSKFGETDSKKLLIAINPYKHQMSYSRKGFISLSLKTNFGSKDKMILAHEIGHLWWKNAAFGTWEEWLNESFAEYSALIWGEENFNQPDFAKMLAPYQKAYNEPTKISQLSPDKDGWYQGVYLKGAYSLYLLKNKIGNDKMNHLLHNVFINKISNTRLFLENLKQETNQETINEFKNNIQ